MKKMVNDFYESSYPAVMLTLEALETSLGTDYYLNRVKGDLLSAIRGKALVQYFSPYKAVQLSRMSNAFALDEKIMFDSVVKAIESGHIEGRIDAIDNVLYACESDKKAEAITRAITTGKRFILDTKAALMKMSLDRYNIQVRERFPSFLMDDGDDGGQSGFMGMMSGMLGGGRPQRRNVKGPRRRGGHGGGGRGFF